LANAETGQNLVNSNWDIANNVTRNVRSWFAVGNETKTKVEILQLLRATNVTFLVNTDLRVIYNAARADGVLDACSSTTSDGGAAYMTDTTNQLCQALVDGTLWDELSTDVNFPTVICHSPDDELVGLVNVPSVSDTPFVMLYDPSLPALVPGGTHAEAEISCALDPVTVLAFGEVDTPVQLQTVGYLLLQEEPSRTVPAFCKQITVEDMGGVVEDVPTVAPAYYDERLFDKDSDGSLTLLTWSIPGLALTTLVMGNIWCWLIMM
jgi:hypothetical protein